MVSYGCFILAKHYLPNSTVTNRARTQMPRAASRPTNIRTQPTTS